jgi:hypothetical protein
VRWRGKRVAWAGGALAGLLAGVLVWQVVADGGAGDDLGDRCRGVLPIEEVRAHLGPGQPLSVGSRDAGESVAPLVEYECRVISRGTRESAPWPSLEINLSDAASVPGPGALATDFEAAPLGSGWTGSYRPGIVSVLVGCPEGRGVIGGGLLISVEDHHQSSSPRSEPDLDRQESFVELATGLVDAFARERGCAGGIGQPVRDVPVRESRESPVGEAAETCEGLTQEQLLAAGVDSVTQYTAGVSLSEACGLQVNDDLWLPLTATYGPGAAEQRQFNRDFPLEESGRRGVSLIAVRICPSPLTSGYYQLDVPQELGEDPALQALLNTFAEASAARHGCTSTIS